MKKVLLLAVPVVSLFFFLLLYTSVCYIYISTQQKCDLLSDVLYFYKNTLNIDGTLSIIINSCLWTGCVIGFPFIAWLFVSRKKSFPKLNLFFERQKTIFSYISIIFSILFCMGPFTQMVLVLVLVHPIDSIHLFYTYSLFIAAPTLFLSIIRDEPSRTKAMISFIGSLVITFVGIPVLALVVFPT